MQSTKPDVPAPLITFAADQPQYEPIAGATVMHEGYWKQPRLEWNTVLLAFRPSDAEREKIAAGADIYVGVLTFGQPLQPLLVMAGKEEAAEVYRMKAPEPATPPAPTSGRAVQTAGSRALDGSIACQATFHVWDVDGEGDNPTDDDRCKCGAFRYRDLAPVAAPRTDVSGG